MSQLVEGNLRAAIMRAVIFKQFTQQSVLRVNIQGQELWFLCANYRIYNPSNHIHHHEIVKGKDITQLIFSSEEFDQDKFITRIDNIPTIQFQFCNNFDWFMV